MNEYADRIAYGQMTPENHEIRNLVGALVGTVLRGIGATRDAFPDHIERAEAICARLVLEEVGDRRRDWMSGEDDPLRLDDLAIISAHDIDEAITNPDNLDL